MGADRAGTEAAYAAMDLRVAQIVHSGRAGKCNSAAHRGGWNCLGGHTAIRASRTGLGRYRDDCRGIEIVINGVTAFLFMSGRKSDVNIEGAFLHMAADAAVSLGVVIAGAVIARTG